MTGADSKAPVVSASIKAHRSSAALEGRTIRVSPGVGSTIFTRAAAMGATQGRRALRKDTVVSIRLRAGLPMRLDAAAPDKDMLRS